MAAKFGILARGGGEAFQEMAQVDIVVFDKTGTLTEGGEPTVSNFELSPANSQHERKVVLGIAAELESASSHPLGIAIRSFCSAQGASTLSGSMFEEVAGRGLKCRFDSDDLQCVAIIGNEAWLEEHDIAVGDTFGQILEIWKSEAKSIVLLAICNETPGHPDSTTSFNIAAVFAVTDRLRPEAQPVVSYLQRQGINTWMISGDSAVTAQAIARMAGIPATNVIAEVLPHEKVASFKI